MNRFIIVDGLPYLYAGGKAYAVRWDNAGFTVGAEVELKSAPARVYNELSIVAQCAGNLDSIGAEPEIEPDTTEPVTEPEIEPDTTEPVEQAEPEEKLLEDMTLAELKELAKSREISMGGARTKAAIIEAINGGDT